MTATVDRFEANFEESTRQRRSLTERLAAEGASIRQVEAQLQSLELVQDVPSEELLLAARGRRDHGWRLIKKDWLENLSPGEDVAGFLAEFGTGGTLAAAYEASVQRGDELADRLRREAERVARKAESLAQLNRHRTAQSALSQDARLLDEGLAQLEREWLELTGPLGIAAKTQTPAELRAWLRQRDLVVLLLEKVNEARQVVEPLEQTLQTHRTLLIRALAAVEGAPSEGVPGLADILDQADAVVKRHDDLSQRRVKLENALATAQAERTNAELSLQTAEAELAGWRSQWSPMMAKIGLEADATPEQAEVFLTKISELLAKLSARRETQSRLRGMDRDAEHFARDVLALTASRCPRTRRSAPRRADAGTGPAAAERPGRCAAMHGTDPAARPRALKPASRRDCA